MAKFYVITDKFELVELNKVLFNVTTYILNAILYADKTKQAGYVIPSTAFEGDEIKFYVEADEGSSISSGITIIMNGTDITDNVVTAEGSGFIVDIKNINGPVEISIIGR